MRAQVSGGSDRKASNYVTAATQLVALDENYSLASAARRCNKRHSLGAWPSFWREIFHSSASRSPRCARSVGCAKESSDSSSSLACAVDQERAGCICDGGGMKPR